MRIIYYFLIIAILFSSCNQGPSAEGMWKLSYELRDGEKTQIPFASSIMDFSGDSLHVISYALNTGGKTVEIDTLKVAYTFNGSFLKFNDKGTNVEMMLQVFEDSLIWSFGDTSVSKSVFVSKKLVPNSNDRATTDLFVGKSFSIENKGYHDSVYFVDESTFIHTGQNNFGNPASDWELVSYKGFDFLAFNEFLWSMVRINLSKEGGIVLQDNPNSSSSLFMSELIGNLKMDDIIGTWTEVLEAKNLETLPEPGFDKENENVTVQFTNDSVSINYRNKDVTKIWDLTSDSKRIYFKDELKRSGEFWWFQNGSWKIIGKTDKNLTLHVYTGPMKGLGGDTIVLERTEPTL